MIYTALQEAFFTYVKVSSFAAMFIGVPVIAGKSGMVIAARCFTKRKEGFLPV